MTKTYFVTASHVSPAYAADRKPVDVKDDGAGRFYAKASPYGCGRSCSTPEAAILDLFRANGCTAVTISTGKEPAMTQDEAKAYLAAN